jgi:uncharacterized protein YqfA (UPF0365 family)
MDYYRMTNIKADTEMRGSIGQGWGPTTPPSAGPTEP